MPTLPRAQWGKQDMCGRLAPFPQAKAAVAQSRLWSPNRWDFGPPAPSGFGMIPNLCLKLVIPITKNLTQRENNDTGQGQG